MTPMVADVHFSANVALAAAEVADKVRINPGNFAPVHEGHVASFHNCWTNVAKMVQPSGSDSTTALLARGLPNSMVTPHSR